jgi:hypothetical protein
MPYAWKISARPSPVVIRPMFSIDEYASRRFISVCTVLNTTPNSALAKPSANRTTPHHQAPPCSRSKETRSSP